MSEALAIGAHDLATPPVRPLTDRQSAFWTRRVSTGEQETEGFDEQSQRTNDAPLLDRVGHGRLVVVRPVIAEGSHSRLDSWTNLCRQYVVELARKVIQRQRQPDRQMTAEQINAEAKRMALTALPLGVTRDLCIAESAAPAAPAFEGPSGTIRERLSEFRGMEEGWLNGDGIAPSEEGLDWLADALERHYPAGWPRPHLYPTEEGYIRAEWTTAHCDARIEFDLASKRGDWFAFGAGKDDSEEDLDFSSEAGWQRLAELLIVWVGAE